MPAFVLIGCPNSRRIDDFQAALQQLGLPPARVVFYTDLLAGRITLPDVVQTGDIVRLESPGRDWPTELALLSLVADGPETEYEWLSRAEVEALQYQKGRLWPSRQWYRGWCQMLQLIKGQLQQCPPHRVMNAPHDIAIMFDKTRCQALMNARNISVPRALGSPRNWDELVASMEAHRCRRVFVKLAHGSSASGVVAFQTNGTQHRATTTVEVVRDAGDLKLFNSRRIKVLSNVSQIAELVNALCRHQVHVEEWLPKAGWQGRVFDLRVMVIGGKAQHAVVRTSRTPMTNLHLLNERGDVDAVRARVGESNWRTAMETCERVMQLFPESLYSGLDLMWTPDLRRHAIIEANAFGDLLPAVLHQGRDTYGAEIEAMLQSSREAA
jgi:glutathione synthase/RimK-type ligase-like ATP-grasp enzyme